MKVWDFSKLDLLRRQRELAEGRDVTWEEIADATGISVTTLIRYRQGRVTDPRVNGLLALCEYFDKPISYWEVGGDAQQ